MRRFLISIAAIAVLAIIKPVVAQQAPPPVPAQPQWRAAGYVYPYRINAATPMDAYRQGLITRWELERLEGPMPQALQGPSVDGSKAEPGR